MTRKEISALLTYDLLYTEYIVNNKSGIDLANELHIGIATLNRYLKKFNIIKSLEDKNKNISKNKQSRTREEIEAELNKAKQTNLERYGTETPQGLQEFKEKAKQTCIEHFGVDNPAKATEVQDKIKATNLEKYGCENPFGAQEVKEKIKQTNLEIYGCENPSQNEEVRKKQAQKYTYNGISFDSSWEIAFYIYHTDLNHIITRETAKYSYEFEGKQHQYFVDFTVDNINYEIKSDYLLRQMINNTESIEHQKYLCMLANNITIITKKEMQPILEYIIKNYGQGYLEQFRNKI